MATGKRYYWIKLRETFMTSDTVDFLMSQKDGANYVVLYQMLCLKTINTGGRLSRTIGEIVIPYDVEKIQRDCKWFSADTIRVALNLYKRFGLIYEEYDGTLVLAEHDSMVGSETDYAEKNRRMRARQVPELPEGGHNVSTDVSSDVSTDIRDKRLDIRDKSTDTDTHISDTKTDDSINETEETTSSCAERCETHPSTQDESPQPTPSEFDIILQDGTFYNVPQENVEYYKKLYPGVDIEQALRNMMGWSNDAGPNRKTRRGIKRFITNWLIREQDNASRKGGARGAVNRGRSGESPRKLFDGETVV